MSKPTAAVFSAFPHGPGQSPDAMTSLPNGQIKGLGVVGLGGNDPKDYKVGCIRITTGTIPGSPSGSGTAALYLATSEDGVIFTDNLDPNSTNGAAQLTLFVAGQKIAQNLIQQITCRASATAYYFDAFSVLQRIGYVPTFFGLFVMNNTGAAFATTATAFVAGYKQIDFT